LHAPPAVYGEYVIALSKTRPTLVLFERGPPAARAPAGAPAGNGAGGVAGRVGAVETRAAKSEKRAVLIFIVSERMSRLMSDGG
jgi:hypothetical protein